MANDSRTAFQSERLGPYELRSELGRGAMARVWRAFDPNLEREVAIKEPLFDQSLPQTVLDEMATRFVKEGRAAARLNHPNIVTIHAADVYDGRPAIVMELVDGTTLGNLLERGALSPAETLDILDQLLDAVGYAHENSIVHRDIKPDNIFIDTAGRVKLADFGIAHVEDAGAGHATVVGTVLGTPGYMSPEQATGGAVDGRSDLFSVAVVGYEMLTGANPFGAGTGGDNTTLLYRIVHEPVADLPDSTSAGLSADVRPAIMAALSKDPNARPQTAAEFKAALHGGAAPRGVAASPTLASTVSKSGYGLPKWLPFAAAGVALLAILGVLMFSANSPMPTPDPSQASSSGSASANSQDGSNDDSGAGSPASAEQDSPNGSAAAESTHYLGVSEGRVAVFENDRATPVQITELMASDLDADTAARLDAHIPCADLQDVLAQVDGMRTALAEAAAADAAAAAEAEAAATNPGTTQGTRYVKGCNEFITLRSAPDNAAGVNNEITRIPLDAQVEWIDFANDKFSHVTYNGFDGYVLTEYLSTDSEGKTASTLFYTGGPDNLYAQPSVDSAIVCEVPGGSTPRLIAERSDGFTEVSYDGNRGFMNSETLEPYQS